MRRKSQLFAAAIAGIASVAGSTAATAQPSGPRVYIPFAASGNIVTWIAETDNSIFLQDRSGRWYQADFTGPCKGVSLNQPVAFGTDALGNFDVFSTVRTRDIVCHVKAISRSADPRKS